MEWSHEAKLEYLLRRVTWTVRAETTPEGDRILRCVEIPDAVGSGETDEEIEADFWESLRASLEAYLHFGERPPVTRNVVLPWESGRQGIPTPMATIVVVNTAGVHQHEERLRTVTVARQEERPLAIA